MAWVPVVVAVTLALFTRIHLFRSGIIARRVSIDRVQEIGEQTSRVTMSIDSDIVAFDPGDFRKNVERFAKGIPQV